MQRYQIFGQKPVEIVVEMGLGSCLSEWMPMARRLEGSYGVLLYERAGINQSQKSDCERTPKNIANELYELLETIPHTEKIILLAHSQGGLYAQQFCRLYPNLVKKLILLDPLSANDMRFKDHLSKQEYKKSGVDKSMNFKIMRVLAQLKLGNLTKMLLKNAPPLYYYKDYQQEEINDILNSVKRVDHATTALEEYRNAHEAIHVNTLISKDGFPDIPLILITHSSELAIEESMRFGGNDKVFATKIENMWQELMKEYLTFSQHAIWIQAQKSTHYIHLQEPQRILEILEMIGV